MSPLKIEIIEKLNKLLKKQSKLKEEYKRTLESKENDRSKQSFNPIDLEEGDRLKDDSYTNDDVKESVDKPLFGNFDIFKGDSLTEVNRNRRKNRQRHYEFLMSGVSDDFEALPDQSQSETITRHSVHKKSASHLPNVPRNFHLPHGDSGGGNTYSGHKKNDIRLEIPISLDATISLPKNKQSLEELLDFVMKHDASLLEEYLLEKSRYGPQLEVVSPSKTYYPPPDSYDTSHQSHHPLHEHTTVPDRSHNSYAAVLKPEPNYGLPEKPHQHKEHNHFLF